MELLPLGKLLEKMRLLDYWEIDGQVIEPPYFTFAFWIDAVRQFFCCHQYERLYRLPREGEQGKPELAGCVESEQMTCRNCEKIVTR